MKNLARKTLSLAAFLLVTSCGGTEESAESGDRISSVRQESEDARITEEKQVTASYEPAFENTTTEEQSTKTLTALAVEPEPTQVTDLTAPVAPVPPHAQNGFLAGVHDVHPMLANYVGSYGVLPTRIAKDGPFLYSLPVDPDGRRRRHHSDFSDD